MGWVPVCIPNEGLHLKKHHAVTDTPLLPVLMPTNIHKNRCWKTISVRNLERFLCKLRCQPTRIIPGTSAIKLIGRINRSQKGQGHPHSSRTAEQILHG